MKPTDSIIILVAGTAFGATFGLNEILLTELGPLSISALRVGTAAIGCWDWMLAQDRAALAQGRATPRLALLGLFQFALPFALLPFAQLHITSSVAGIANALTPVVTLVVSLVLVTGERANAAKVAGLGFGALGAIVLVSGNGHETGSDPRYVLLAVLTTFSYAFALNIARTLGRISPTVAITWALTFGFVLIAPLALLVEGVPEIPSPTTLASIMTMGLGLTAIPFMVLYALMQRIGATNVSLVTFVAPVSALAIGALLFDETVTSANLIGVFLIILGLIAVDGRLLRDGLTSYALLSRYRTAIASVTHLKNKKSVTAVEITATFPKRSRYYANRS